ncbi:MAG: archease [Anaerolineae bacterium]|nr:archease [Anaerolineae bacterium]
MATEPPWEEIPHTADWSIRVRGADRRALFENAARGMISLLERPQTDRPSIERRFSLQAHDDETLLVDWLTELVYLLEEEGLVFNEISVEQAVDHALDARISGRPGGRYGKHIKAVTYHLLEIREVTGGFETTLVFDV